MVNVMRRAQERLRFFWSQLLTVCIFSFNLLSPSSDKWMCFHLKELERTIAQLLHNKEFINFTLFTQWIEARDVTYKNYLYEA